MQAVGKGVGDHHDDVDDVAGDDGEGRAVEGGHLATEEAQQVVGHGVVDEGAALDEEERQTDLDDLATDRPVELHVGLVDLEVGLVAHEVTDGDGPDADRQAVIDAGAGDAEVEDEGGEGQPDGGDDGRGGHEVGGLVGLLVDAQHGGQHLAQDGERQQQAEGAHAGDGVGENIGGGAKGGADLRGEELEEHGDDKAGVEGQPEGLAEDLLGLCLVTCAEVVADHRGHARAVEVAEGQVDVLHGHDDAHACQAVCTETGAHDDALDDHHDDLGDHAAHRDDAVLVEGLADRGREQLALLCGLLRHRLFFFCHDVLPLSTRKGVALLLT